VERAIVASYER